MSREDLVIIHEALCFVMKPENADKFDKFMRRNLRRNPEAYNEFVRGKRSNNGHELIGRIVSAISDLDGE